MIRRRIASPCLARSCRRCIQRVLWLEPNTTDLSLQPRYCDPYCECIRRCHGRLDSYRRSIRPIPVGSLVLNWSPSISTRLGGLRYFGSSKKLLTLTHTHTLFSISPFRSFLSFIGTRLHLLAILACAQARTSHEATCSSTLYPG